MKRQRDANSRLPRLTCTTLLCAVGVGLGSLWSGQASAGLLGEAKVPVERFVLVVGSNATLDAAQAPLRFADDDAARVAELFAETGAQVELLSTFDTESQARFGDLVSKAHRPQRAELQAAMGRLSARIATARGAGKQTEFIFYYSGHGDVGGDGRSYLTLEDGPLTRQDLFQGLLSKSGAQLNHVVLDACQSEEFVLARGDWKDDRVKGEQAQAVRGYLDRNQLSHFPNTGVILASSVDQQTHEWERYRGGIFTHELLSGLRGAADINGDGAVEYSELGAFVSAANRGVTDPRARLEVTVLPPASDQRAPVFASLDPSGGRVLYFAGRVGSRYQIEDARGVRLADLRRSPGRPAYLRVPEGELFVHRGERGESEAKISADVQGVVHIESMEFAGSERASRGALDEAFRKGLFEVPYGLGYYAGFTESTQLLSVADPDWQVRVWGKDENGELVEVARVEGKGDAPAVTADADDDDDDDDDNDAHDHKHEHQDHRPPKTVWGSVSVGLEFTPYNPEGQITGQPKRVIANEFHGFGSSGFGRPLRGVDLRWWGFQARGRADRPGADGYFRSGYTQGSANFVPTAPDGRFQDGAATRLEYFTVPLFFGGNIYAFRRFPLRPFAGAGAGFDILSVDYTRADGSSKRDVSARIGFELHAGLDLRINNWFSLVGEVRQLWSARRKIAGLPDYSNEGLTLVSSIRVGFPLRERRRGRHVHVHTEDMKEPFASTHCQAGEQLVNKETGEVTAEGVDLKDPFGHECRPVPTAVAPVAPAAPPAPPEPERVIEVTPFDTAAPEAPETSGPELDVAAPATPE